MRTSNNKAKGLVNKKEIFKGNNIFSEMIGDNYVVFSYGKHFPMYAFIKGQWYANSDKYSVSTSKHQSQTYPSDASAIIYKTTAELKDIIGI